MGRCVQSPEKKCIELKIDESFNVRVEISTTNYRGAGKSMLWNYKKSGKTKCESIVVVPKTFCNEDKRFTTIQDAGEIPSKYLESGSKEFWKKVQYREII